MPKVAIKKNQWIFCVKKNDKHFKQCDLFSLKIKILLYLTVFPNIHKIKIFTKKIYKSTKNK